MRGWLKVVDSKGREWIGGWVDMGRHPQSQRGDEWGKGLLEEAPGGWGNIWNVNT